MPTMDNRNPTSAVPEITIIMPVRNERDTIARSLDCALGQVVDVPLEVVVADGDSDDGTRETLEVRRAEDPRLRIVRNPARNTPSGLNRALEAARGRYVVRLDGHSTFPSDYVQRMVDRLRAGTCEAAGGLKVAVGFSPFGRAVAVAHSSRFGIGNAKHHYASESQYVDHIFLGAYLTDLSRQIGGFDVSFIRNQDYEFDYRYGRAGGRLLLDPSVEVEWRVRETPVRLASQYFQYGFWRCRCVRLHPRSLTARWLVPPTLVVVLAGGAATSWTGPGRRLLASAAGGYGTALAGVSITLARRTGVKPHNLAAAFATMHLAWGAGFALSAAGTQARRFAWWRSTSERRQGPVDLAV
jgi:succinoglycan biosynthesis protein ExoA